MDRQAEHTLICDYLDALGVPHTKAYSDRRFGSMPFHTLFGLSKLLEEYGVESEGYCLSDKSELSSLQPPFLAQTDAGLVIVTSVGGGSVGYMTQGVAESMPASAFEKAWTGNVLLSFPSEKSAEPDYGLHARLAFFMRAKKWVLAFCCMALLAWFFVTRGLYRDLSTIFITCVDLFGLYITYLLVQKSMNIHSAAADRVCGVLQEGGMRQDPGHRGLEILRTLRMERGGILLFLGKPACHAVLPLYSSHARPVQPVLSAFHGLEHMVSEIPGPSLVHSVRLCPGLPVASLLMLSFRRMAAHGIPAYVGLPRAWCLLRGCHARTERTDAVDREK